MINTDISNRMKDYESIPKNRLYKRTPVIIRCDGKCFKKFTNKLNKPFDDILTQSMQKTMEYLCKNIQGCVFGYTQSDEITLVLVDYANLNSSAWFDYEVQKLCSISASMATFKFNQVFFELACKYVDLNNYDSDGHWLGSDKYWKALQKNIHNGAMFDSRCFNIPKEEVCNLIYWRQLDARRNSVSMIGRCHFTQKELQHKSYGDIIEMLNNKGIDVYKEYETYRFYGTACYKNEDNKWFIDMNLPMLIGNDRHIVEDLI